MAYYNYNEKYSPNCESFSGCFYFVIDNTFKTDGGFISMYEGILILLKKKAKVIILVYKLLGI